MKRSFGAFAILVFSIAGKFLSKGESTTNFQPKEEIDRKLIYSQHNLNRSKIV